MLSNLMGWRQWGRVPSGFELPQSRRSSVAMMFSSLPVGETTLFFAVSPTIPVDGFAGEVITALSRSCTPSVALPPQRSGSSFERPFRPAGEDDASACTTRVGLNGPPSGQIGRHPAGRGECPF